MMKADVICANAQCRVAEDGKCVEGYEDLGTCPFYGKEPEEVDDEQEGEEQEAVTSFDGIALPGALALETGRANRVLAHLPSRMVGIIGIFDSGKTSVIGGLFDLFQLGPISETMFAGSSTLHGLEMICHDARVTSERDEPHSERTKRGEVRFYHIDVSRNGVLQSLLIADRSGEEYEEVADLAANASGMFELRRADVITILVDGGRLASPADRAEAMGAIPQIIQGMMENGAFERRPNLAIVLTKDDAVQASPRKDRVATDFQAIIDNIRAAHREKFGEFASFVTAASPKEPNFERGAGLPALLDFWLKPSSKPLDSRPYFRSGRVFDGLAVEEINRD